MLRAIKNTSFWTLFFLLLQALVLVRNWITNYWIFYWFCDFAPTIFAISFALKQPQWIKGMISIGLIGQTLFLISFLNTLFFGQPLFGFPINLTSGIMNIAITVLMHCSTLFALGATRNIKPAPSSLVASLVILSAMYALVLWQTDPITAIDWNFNYIYSSLPLASIPHYTELWIPIAFISTVLPTYILQHIIFYFSPRSTTYPKVFHHKKATA